MECQKHVYKSRRAANEVVNSFKKHVYTKLGQRINRSKGKKDKKLKRVYYCDVCQGWHITSQEPKF